MNNIQEILKNLSCDNFPDNFTFSGKIYRWGKKDRYWAIGKEWEYKSNTYQMIKYGDFREANVFTWKSYDVTTQTKEFKKRQSEAISEIAAKEKYERDLKHEDCKRKWVPVFHSLVSDSEVHPYLQKKHIESNYTAKVKDETLYIPVIDPSGLNGIQFIMPDPENPGKFIKRFTTGVKKQGSYCPIPDKNSLSNAEFVFIAEGFATAASVHMATKQPAVCAFDCQNIHAAIQSIRLINPNCKIIICADDDKNGIGMKKALSAKNHFSNVVVKKPRFEQKDDTLTDFNDLHCAESLDQVKSQLQIHESDFVQVFTLGHFGDKTTKYFYFSTMTNKIYQFTATEHTKINLTQMAPKKYWGEKYGYKKDKDGNTTSYPDWDNIPEKLFLEHAREGFFNFKNIRGVGPWIDDSLNHSFVYNLGDRLLINNEEILKIDSDYLYQSSSPINIGDALTDEESGKIIDLFRSLNYKNPSDYIYVCGWVAMAPIFNFLDWRPQLWLTGKRGSGKTSILSMVSKLVGESEIIQSATAASIRQYLKHDARTIVIDEAEPNNIESQKRMDGVIELIRQCTSRTNTKTLRGSSSGDVMEYNVSACFLLASIQVYLPTEADTSRFYVVEMNSNEGADPENWKKTQKLFSEVEDFYPRLLKRMILLAPVVKHNIKEFRDLLLESGSVKEARQADQIATSLACFWALWKSKKISEPNDYEMALRLIEKINLRQSSYVQDTDVDESENCLDAILSAVIDRSMNKTVATCIDNLKKGNQGSYDDSLAMMGMQCKNDKGRWVLRIQSKNQELLRSIDKLGFPNYASILRRSKRYIKNESKKDQFKLNGKNVAGITLDITEID